MLPRIMSAANPLKRKSVVFEEGEGGGIKIHGVFDNPEQARAHFDGFDGPALLPAYFLVSREGCSEVWQ